MITTRPSAASSPFNRRRAPYLVLLAALMMGYGNVASAFEIFIESNYLETFPLEVEATDTVLDVKGWIEVSGSVPAAEQVLSLAGLVLEDDQTLDSYGIGEGSALTLSIPTLDAEIRRLQALFRKVQSLKRQIDASVKSLERAKTLKAFKRSRTQLASQIKGLIAVLVSAGPGDPELAELRPALNRLRRVIVGLKFRKTPTRPSIGSKRPEGQVGRPGGRGSARGSWRGSHRLIHGVGVGFPKRPYH